MSTTTRLQESTAGFNSIDRGAGVIRGVKVLGLQSRNRRGSRRYLKEAAQQGKALYEGRKIYIDHVKPSKDDKSTPARTTRERWGKLKDLVEDASGELYGDLHYLKTHPMTEQILEAAERFNDFGLSHDAAGKVREENGEEIVYELTEVFSVDIVQEPATNRNLFESVQQMSKKNVVKALREHIKIKPAPFLLARLTEMDDLYDAGMEMEVEEESTPEEQVREAFKTAIMAILDSDYSTDEAIDKIRKLLDVQAEIDGSGSGERKPKQTETKDGDSTMTEQEEKQLRDELAQLREEKQASENRSACTKILEDCGREVTDVRLKAMALLPDDSDRKALAESFPAKNVRPASSPSKVLQEQAADEAELPKDHDDFKRRLGL